MFCPKFQGETFDIQTMEETVDDETLPGLYDKILVKINFLLAHILFKDIFFLLKNFNILHFPLWKGQ